MSINYKILGKIGRDNSVFVWINSGTELNRILIDCGENVLTHVKQSDVKNVDQILFSHLHIDHIAGFDYLFRRIFERNDKFNIVYGPDKTSEIIYHRLNGFKWNLISDLKGVWEINDIVDDKIITYRYFAGEGFSNNNIIDQISFNKKIFEDTYYRIEAAILNHKIPSIGFSIIEKDLFKIDKQKLEELNLQPGNWLQNLRDSDYIEENIDVNGINYSTQSLRKKVLLLKKGEKLTYLTDFIFDENNRKKAVELAENSDVLICESQYSKLDHELANKNYHLTSVQAAQIAKEARIKKLILFHISERYIHKENYGNILNEARKIFPNTFLPENWEK